MSPKPFFFILSSKCWRGITPSEAMQMILNYQGEMQWRGLEYIVVVHQPHEWSMILPSASCWVQGSRSSLSNIWGIQATSSPIVVFYLFWITILHISEATYSNNSNLFSFILRKLCQFFGGLPWATTLLLISVFLFSCVDCLSDPEL